MIARVSAAVTMVLVCASSGLAQAPAPTAPGHEIDQKQVCLSCHEIDAEKVTHAPVRDGRCSACHNPHVARYASLLRDRPGPLCGTCHGRLAGQLARANVHRPVAEGRCAECHRPHGSANQGLLVASAGQLCATCHDEVAGWKQREVQHAPFAQGRCSACHDPHSSAGPGLLVREGAALCTACHAGGEALRRSHAGQPVDTADCQQCHEPHASARAGLFRESVHAPFATGDCSTCHRGAKSADAFALNQPEDRLCGGCHPDQVQRSREAPFPHASAGGGGCTSCHNPHTGDGSLLHAPVEAVCTTCHDPGGASSGAKGRHASHSGLECTSCHEAHGGDRPLLFAEDTVALCGSCHSHEHGVRHPLGEDTRDPRTGNPMDCRSCHGIHRADGDKYLYESDVRMLCVSCHKEMVGR